jgi:hypothetical protein
MRPPNSIKHGCLKKESNGTPPMAMDSASAVPHPSRAQREENLVDTRGDFLIDGHLRLLLDFALQGDQGSFRVWH